MEKTSISTTLDDMVREAIKNSSCSFVDKILNNVNSAVKAKLSVESVGVGADVMFRIIESSNPISLKVMSPFVNVISLATIVVSYYHGINNPALIMISVRLLELAHEKKSDKAVYLHMLKTCTDSYTTNSKLIADDKKEYDKKILSVTLEDLKEL